MRINTVKQALKEGKTQFGCSTSMLRSPEVPRILAAAGLNWTYLDSEHGAFDLETLQDLIRAANDSGLCPIVRVADLNTPWSPARWTAAPKAFSSRASSPPSYWKKPSVGPASLPKASAASASSPRTWVTKQPPCPRSSRT